MDHVGIPAFYRLFKFGGTQFIGQIESLNEVNMFDISLQILSS